MSGDEGVVIPLHGGPTRAERQRPAASVGARRAAVLPFTGAAAAADLGDASPRLGAAGSPTRSASCAAG